MLISTVIKRQLNRTEKYFYGQPEMTLSKKRAKKCILSYRDARKMIVAQTGGGGGGGGEGRGSMGYRIYLPPPLSPIQR